jgi:S-adenosylmethionine decarboxylase
LGHHILASLYGVSFLLLDDVEAIQEVFEKAVEACGATVLNRFAHKFEPQGVTVVYALAESHISAHTFPEKGTVALDCYTCGDMNSMAGMQILIDYFQPKDLTLKEVER